jgi:hypothetical protein
LKERTLEHRIRECVKALPPAARAEFVHVPIFPDFDRRPYPRVLGDSGDRTFAEP